MGNKRRLSDSQHADPPQSKRIDSRQGEIDPPSPSEANSTYIQPQPLLEAKLDLLNQVNQIEQELAEIYVVIGPHTDLFNDLWEAMEQTRQLYDHMHGDEEALVHYTKAKNVVYRKSNEMQSLGLQHLQDSYQGLYHRKQQLMKRVADIEAEECFQIESMPQTGDNAEMPSEDISDNMGPSGVDGHFFSHEDTDESDSSFNFDAYISEGMDESE